MLRRPIRFGASVRPRLKKLDALLASLNGSAERFQTLWFSFLGLTLYLAIAALATTHRDLLLNNPQTLPILNIKVELLPFYVIAPLLYLVFHFYLLMMLALLARTAAEFDKQLRSTLPVEPERERYRAQVGNALFLQLLVGMKGERAGVNALLMGLIALITIVLAPLATLVLMQMMFLPYHHLRITWWHRAVVVADLVLIIVMTYRCFFPRGVRKAPLVLGALSRKPRWATAMAFCVVLTVVLTPLVDWLSFQQGRWAGEPRPPTITEWGLWMEGKPPAFPNVNPNYSETMDGVVFGLFPDRLKLRDETIVGEQRIEETEKEMMSRGGDFVPTIKLNDRDLQASVLTGADLRGVSLRSATMQGADLSAARLDGAHLDVATRLQGANLSSAKLQGADLSEAQLQGANLSSAQLPGAELYGAKLQGADLSNAQLQGADLSYAQLQGADFGPETIKLLSISIIVSPAAQLQGANLSSASLQGANLSLAQLEGANLSWAQMQGTSLLRTQLQGANLRNANVTASAFDETYVFRTSISYVDLATAAVRSVHSDQVKDTGRGFGSRSEPFTLPDVEAWIDAAKQFARGLETAEIVERFDRLKKDFQTVEDGTDTAKWKTIEDTYRSSDHVATQYRLGKFLGDLACESSGAPYVARGLIHQRAISASHRLAELGDQVDKVRTRMKEGRKNPDKCLGVIGFTEDDWRQLDAIDAPMSNPASPLPPPSLPPF